MNIKIILIIAFAIWIIFGCTNNQTVQKLNSSHTPSHQTETIDLYDDDSIFNEPMRKAINEFIDYIKSLNFKTAPEERVYTFCFYSEKGKDYLMLSSEQYYIKELVKGYTYIGNFIFVYYGEEDTSKKYILTNKLTSYQDTLPGFHSYDDAPPGYYDPFGILFQILNPDSLILIRKGML